MGEIYTAPSTANQIADFTAGTYVQLLFALRYRNLGSLDGVFASYVYMAFKKLEVEWKSLVEDIHRGGIRRDLDISQEIRDQLAPKLKADPERANELLAEFEQGKTQKNLFTSYRKDYGFFCSQASITLHHEFGRTEIRYRCYVWSFCHLLSISEETLHQRWARHHKEDSV